MCDLLIYRGPNWLDDSNAYALAHYRIEIDSSLTSAQIMKSKDVLSLKYENRYRKGDIIDIYPEGTMTETFSPNNKCVGIRIEGLAYETAKQYLSHLEDAQGVIRRKRKFQVLWDDLPQAMKDKLRDERFLITTKAKAIPFIKEHTA